MMNYDVEKLINRAMDLEGIDKDKVIKIMADGLRDKEPEKKVYEKLYREIYDGRLSDDCCIKLVESLYQGDEKGQKWSIEDAKSVASHLDIDFDKTIYTLREFWAAMHIQYYDMYCPLKKSGVNLEPSAWGRLGDFYFTADDEPADKIVDYFFWRMDKED